MVIDEQALGELDAEQLREVTQRLLTELRHQRALNEKLAYECALLKRLKFAAQSERHSADQRNLLEEEFDSDLAAVEHEIEQLRPVKPASEKQQPKRTPLPANLPRREIRHEPTSATCQCGCQLKRIGEDVAEKLDYVPGVFIVERHVRGKWACAKCQTLTQAPVAAHVIDKGIPTAGLLAQVLVAKYADHQPLYRQENIFGRAGLAIPRSTLAQWVGTCGARLQPLVDALKAEVLSAPGVARRRDAGGHAQAGQRQDAPGLPVGLCPRERLKPCAPWSTTSASPAPASTPAPSWAVGAAA
jgi:transposase